MPNDGYSLSLPIACVQKSRVTSAATNRPRAALENFMVVLAKGSLALQANRTDSIEAAFSGGLYL
jgi:hypothetical protein